MERRQLKLRELARRLRGGEEDSYQATRDAVSPLAAIVVATLMYALFFTLRMLDESPSSGFALLFSIPIAILALRFGVRGGLAAAAVAEVLFVIAALTEVDYPGVSPYLTRAITFFTLGMLVGYLSERLAENETHFVLALGSTSLYVFTMDRDLRYTWAYHGLTRRLATEIIGKTDFEIVPPEQAEPIVALKLHTLESGEAQSEELQAYDLDGRLCWFRISVEPYRDPTGRVSGLIGSAVEVTELREAYGELARNEERFRSAIENMIEPFALYSAVRDANGEIVDFRCDYVNQPGADAVNLPAEQMQGRLLSELYAGRLEFGLIDRYREVVETGRPHEREEVDYINVFGEQTLVRGFDIRVAKVGDGIEITWRDITDRKQEESSRDWSAAIVDASIDAIMSADRNGTIKSWSRGAERLYGWKAEEIVGRKFMDVLMPETSKPSRSRLFSRVIGGESVGPVRAVEKHRDGSTLDVTFTATPVCDDDGAITGVARIVRPSAVAIVEAVPEGDGRATSGEVPF